MRVALVHDWLTGLRGGERVLHEIAGWFPDADLYTLLHVPGSTTERIDALRIHKSPLARIPGIERHYRRWLPLFPWAISRFELSGYDLVLSTSHAVAKGVRIAGGTPHLCYCFTPIRYVWDQADAYLGRGLRRAIATPLLHALRRYDRRTSTPERVQRFVACSATVADRIRRHYGREAAVVHPPVDLERFRPDGREPDDFFLMVAGCVPYKREEVVIEAFAHLGERFRLVVAGDGPGRARLERASPRHVEWRGRVSDEELARLYARCRALVFPSDEDFGIVPLEAQASGRPVIAYRSGGALETVVGAENDASLANATGLWFERQTPADVASAVERFARLEPLGEGGGGFSAASIRRHAEGFSAAHFRSALEREIASLGAPVSGGWAR